MRATTFSPRSWPSRPSLAKTMRTGPPWGAWRRALMAAGSSPYGSSLARLLGVRDRLRRSHRSSLDVGPELGLEGLDDLALGGPGPHGVDEGRHEVDGGVGGVGP